MTTNDTQFARHYMAASRLLMMAIAEPTAQAFADAGREAVRAIGSSFAGSTDGGSIEWNLAQSLARAINEARAASGVGAPPPRMVRTGR
jgi:hypothetical protein